MSADIEHYPITGIDNANYNDSHKYNFSLQPRKIQIHYVGGSNLIYYSFDGKNDHGSVGNDGGQIQVQTHEPFTSKIIYLRGGTGDETINVTVST